MTMPARTLGQAIDNLYEARAARLTKAKEVDELRVLEVKAKAVVLEMLNQTGLSKASGMFATAGIMTTNIPFIKDWNAVHEYIKTNDRFDLLQRRIGVVAWRELYDNGILVPGTESAVDTDISLTKSTRN